MQHCQYHSMPFTVITHSDNIVFVMSLSLSLSPPLPLDELVLIEDKELARFGMSAKLSL